MKKADGGNPLSLFYVFLQNEAQPPRHPLDFHGFIRRD